MAEQIPLNEVKPFNVQECTSPSWSSLCSVGVGLHRAFCGCWQEDFAMAKWPQALSVLHGLLDQHANQPLSLEQPLLIPLGKSWWVRLEMIWGMFDFLELLSQTNLFFMGSHVRINSLAFWYGSLNGWLMNSSKVSNFHVHCTSDFAGKLNLAFFSVFV